jgi:protein-S-isoprenylcysteine O-methyltransferase Ste14
LSLSIRWLRLRAVWLLIVPFLWLATPTPALLVAGLVLAAVGLGVRAWAAGFIQKDRVLTTTGPYAFTRNPLYLGSLLLGLGTVIAGGKWLFVAVFLAFFALVYGRTMKREEAHLEEAFNDRYRHYAERVPLLVPRLAPYRGSHPGGGAGFSVSQYRRNREWEALLGAAAGFAFLAVKMLWLR